MPCKATGALKGKNDSTNAIVISFEGAHMGFHVSLGEGTPKLVRIPILFMHARIHIYIHACT